MENQHRVLLSFHYLRIIALFVVYAHVPAPAESPKPALKTVIRDEIPVMTSLILRLKPNPEELNETLPVTEDVTKSKAEAEAYSISGSFTTSWSSNQRVDDVSMVTAMRRSHWMRGPNVLSNGWFVSTELF